LVCYIRKYVIILGGGIPVDVPQPKYWGGCVPDIPGGVDACARSVRLRGWLHDAATLSLQRNQTNVTDYDIRGSSLVSVGCLAERKRTISRRVQKRSGMEQFRHFGSVFVKEVRETGKVVAQKPCLFTRQSRSVATRQSQAASATLSRDKVAHSCDKIAR